MTTKAYKKATSEAVSTRQTPVPISVVGTRQFIKARPLASRFGVNPRTLFRWADAGFIHRHKLNPRLVLFDESEVLAFIERSRVV